MGKLASGLCLSASVISFMGAAIPVMAQTHPADTADARRGVGEAEIGDIVVTARRHEEVLQEVPVAITALSGDALAERSVVSVDQLRNFAPALNVSGQDRGDATFYIRGQGPGVLGGGQRNFTSVATYFAEVPTPIAGSGMFYDLANVQVLKGPQGTLFGRNTTGGAVLFEPTKPTFDLGGYVKGSYGNYDYHELEGVLNLPIVEDLLAIRLAGDYGRRHGFTRNVLTGQRLDSRNNDSYRISVLLTPTPDIENVTIVDSNYRDNSGSGQLLRQVYPAANLGILPNPLLFGPTATPETIGLSEFLGLPPSFNLTAGSPSSSYIACLQVALPGCATGPFGNAVAALQAAVVNGGLGLSGLTPEQFAAAQAQQEALGIRRIANPRYQYRRTRDLGVTNKTTWQLSDDITLKNIFSFRKEKTAETLELSGPLSYLYSFYPAGTKPYVRGFEQYTEEFQIQGKAPDIGLSYILGYYHEQAKPGIRQAYRSYSFGSVVSTIQDYDDKSDAVFGHIEFDIAEGLQFSGGVRYTWDSRFASSSKLLDDGTCNQPDPSQFDPATGMAPNVCPQSARAHFSAATGDATIQYKITQRILAYAAYRHGYKSGGFNLPAPTADTRTFAPETVDDIELGLKADWDIGVPLRTNISLFRDKYKDIQIAQGVISGGTFVSAVQNAGRAINKGFEFEGTIVPFQGFSLSGFVSYLDAKCQVNAGAACRLGRQIAYQPHWKYSINGQYRLPLPGETDVTLFASYSFTGKVNTSDSNASAVGLKDSFPGYGTFDARIEWHDAIARGIDLALFGTNLTNKDYLVGGYSVATDLGTDAILAGEPRMYGVSAKYRFEL
ncbi:MAG: TonB-dependent receptor [Sphingomonas sp.]|nr:TonB-dependent receptor [Sphingomonas sp.]